MKKVSAIILAAGSGSRIGKPKLKLKIGEDYFINVIINKLKSSGIKDIVSIIRSEDENWFRENSTYNNFIINEEPELGMLSSIKLGINYLRNSDGVIIFPVDHPFVQTETISGLITAFKKEAGSVVKPYSGRKSGHPLILPSVLFDAVLESDMKNNLNGLIKESNLKITEFDTDDKGIFRNVNYPEDLEGISD